MTSIGNMGRKIVSLIVAVSLLAACDGHIVRLSLKERSLEFPQKAVGRTLEVCAGEDIVGTVRAVAGSLSLTDALAERGVVSNDHYTWCAPDGRFNLHLDHETSGSWTVSLLDWPRPSRSDLSVRAEADIRSRLKDNCVQK